YGIFIRNLAFQPPFATTATNVSPYGDFLTLENGFPSASQTAVTNNYALDPNYRIGYVQIWNLDIQRQLPRNIQLNVGYNGAKGTPPRHTTRARADLPVPQLPGVSARGDCSLHLRILRRQFHPACRLGAHQKEVLERAGAKRELRLLQVDRRCGFDRCSNGGGGPEPPRHFWGARAVEFCSNPPNNPGMELLTPHTVPARGFDAGGRLSCAGRR